MLRLQGFFVSCPRRRALFFAVVLLLIAAPFVPFAYAHGGTVMTCEPTPDSSCTSAVFAICTPPPPPSVNPNYACDALPPSDPNKGPRTVDIRGSGFPVNSTVYIYFIAGADDGTRHDCLQTGPTTVTSLGTDTTDGSGTFNFENQSLPPGDYGQEWVYGTNWVCATSVPANGTAGPNHRVGNQSFIIYPV